MRNHEALADIKAHLQRDGHTEILDRIPPHIFVESKGNIIVDLPALCNCDKGFSPAYAFVLDGTLHFNVTTAGTKWQRLMATEACLECAHLVDPFAKLPLELLVDVESQKHVLSMLEYYLLVCVVDNNYGGVTPVPTYAHLEGMFRMLERAEDYWPWETPRAHGMGMLLDEGHSAYLSLVTDDGSRERAADEPARMDDSAPGSLPEASTGLYKRQGEPSLAHDNVLSPAEPVHKPLAIEYASREDEADEPARRDNRVPRLLYSDRVTAEVTGELHKSVQTVALESSPSLKSNPSMESSVMQDERGISPTSMSPQMLPANPLLRKLHEDLGQKLLKHLPGIDYLDWQKDTTDKRYIPLALQLASFATDSLQFDEDHVAWAYFRKKAGSTLEVYVCDGEGEFIKNGALVLLGKHHDYLLYDEVFKVCRNAQDVVAMTKYFFLLAAEAQDDEQYGLITPTFAYDDDFTDRLRAICRRLKDSASLVMTTLPVDGQESDQAQDQSVNGMNTSHEEHEANGGSQHMILPDRTSLRKRHISETPESSSADELNSEPYSGAPTLRRSYRGPLRPPPSHYTALTPPISGGAQCASPLVAVDPTDIDMAESAEEDNHDHEDEYEQDGSTSEQFSKSPAIDGRYPGYSPKSSDGESEIDHLPPHRCPIRAPQRVVLQSELKRKKSNLESVIGEQHIFLGYAKEYKEELEEELEKLVKEGSKDYRIQGVRNRVCMIDERIRLITDAIEVFEKSRAGVLQDQNELSR